jgi:hypothetical protein
MATLPLDMSTTSSPLNYQYDDIVDDTIGDNNDAKSILDDSQNSVIPDAISLTKDEPSHLIQASLKQTSREDHIHNELSQLAKDSDVHDFRRLMEHRKAEANDFRLTIVCLGLALISIGIAANLLFKLIVLCRKRKRQTSTTLVMFSMCSAYLLFLVFYCFKLSIYFNGDNITKFHIYDTIDNWIYGQFMCKLISGLPISIKLISRLSILTLIAKRILALVLCNCNEEVCLDPNDLNDDDSEMTNLRQSSANKPTRSGRNSSGKMRKLKLISQLFEWPILIIVIAIVWLVSFMSSWPIFASYMLNEPSTLINSNNKICDSVYLFPDDIKSIGSMYLSYFVYSLILPCSIILALLVLLYVLQSSYCFTRMSSPSASGSSTPVKGSQAAKKSFRSASSTASLDEANSSSQHATSCARTRRSSLLLWAMFSIHVSTSVPQELYRYLQLRIDFRDESVLDSYLSSILIQPIVRARPYYAMQLIYVSEFVLMPLVFILFHLCSNTGSRCSGDEVSVAKHGCLSHLKEYFHDDELTKSKTTRRAYLNSNSGSSRRALAKAKRIGYSLNEDALLSRDSSAKNEPKLLVGNGTSHKRINSNPSLKPTPFEMAASLNEPKQSQMNAYQNSSNSNVLHVIQHPEWRINIKQQNQQQQQQSMPLSNSYSNNISSYNSNLYNDNLNDNGIHLPFNYIKTNLYKS